MKAISIRQPWAHAIVHLGKDIENRNWRTRYRGPVLIHASKGMTLDEYQSASLMIMHIQERSGQRVNLPSRGALNCGGIIGAAEIVDCVEVSASPWFFGEHGLVLRNVTALPFIPYSGQLGFFDVPEEIVDRAKAEADNQRQAVLA